MPKRKTYSTPAASASWAYLVRPKTGQYVKCPDGEWSITLFFDKDAKTKASGDDTFIDWLKNEIRDAHAAALAVAKAEKNGEKIKNLKDAKLASPFRDEVDDEGEPTGRVKLTLKNNVSGQGKNGEKFFTTIDLFDAANKRVTKDPKLGQGSVVKAAFSMSPYHMVTDDSNKFGMSFRLQAVQIIELVPYGGGSAESYGFEEEEDGFSSDTLEDSAPFEAEDGGGDSGDTGDADF